MSEVIRRRLEVKAQTGLSESTIDRKVREGTFPRPVSLGARAVGWLASDIDKWIAERVELSRSVQRGAA